MTWQTTRETTICCRRTLHTSECGRWRVVESDSLFGLTPRYYALESTPDGWRMLGRHRELSAAFRRAQQCAARAARDDERAARKAEQKRKRANQLARRRRRKDRA